MTLSRPHKQVLRTLALGTLAAGALTIAGCENADEAKTAVAQECLDKATDATSANACVAKIDGVYTPQSYLIRCSASFVAQGITGQRLASAFDEMNKNGGTSTPPTTAALGYFTFKANSAGTAAQNIAAAANYCERSGVRSMVRLATMANLATTVANLGGIVASIDPAHPDTDAVKNALSTIIANIGNGTTVDNLTPAQQAEQIGTIAQQANEAFCNPGSSFETNDVCKKLSSAINVTGGTTEDIGKKLLECLSNPAAAGCQL